MTERDYVLSVLEAAGDIPGRTMLQKLVYLLSRIERQDLGYSPHFYGPYSAAIQRATNDLRDLDLLSERVTVLPSWAPEQSDVHQYRYGRTEEGRDAASHVDQSLRDAAARLVGAARASHVWGQAPLAAAAKLDHLRQIEAGLDVGDVPALAAQFGWRLSAGDAKHAAGLLQDLGLG
jgi:hypothetical protein